MADFLRPTKIKLTKIKVYLIFNYTSIDASTSCSVSSLFDRKSLYFVIFLFFFFNPDMKFYPGQNSPHTWAFFQVHNFNSQASNWVSNRCIFSWMRHFLRVLPSCLENSSKLGKEIVRFVNLWIALNCDILRGGSSTLEKCIRSQITLKPHPDKHLTRFIQWSKSQASSIDGYVMSGRQPDQWRRFLGGHIFLNVVKCFSYNF